jgi:hypothetical protein
LCVLHGSSGAMAVGADRLIDGVLELDGVSAQIASKEGAQKLCNMLTCWMRCWMVLCTLSRWM